MHSSPLGPLDPYTTVEHGRQRPSFRQSVMHVCVSHGIHILHDTAGVLVTPEV